MSAGFSAVFWGVVTFSLLVVIHEGGHFLAARLFGVKVHEFMLGLPGPALRWHGPKTTYGITAIPLGGYVRIAGMEPGPEDPLLGPVLAAVTEQGMANAFQVAERVGVDEATADRALVTLADWDAIEQVAGDDYTYRSRFDASEAADPVGLLGRARSTTYRALSTWKRVTLLSMGVLLNLLTAVLVFTVVLSAFGDYVDTGRIGAVGEGSAAARAGMVEGDRIVSVDGHQTPDFQRLISTVGRFEPGQTVELTFEHEGVPTTIPVKLGENPETGGPLLGVSPQYEKVDYSVWGALLRSIAYIGMTFVAIAGFFNPATFQVSVSQSSSVIGAAVFAAQAAESGPLSYAGLVAALSLSLGAINILPIPPLDGGKVAIELFERLRGKPLPRNFALGLSASGAALLFALIGYLMYADVMKIVSG